MRMTSARSGAQSATHWLTKNMWCCWALGGRSKGLNRSCIDGFQPQRWLSWASAGLKSRWKIRSLLIHMQPIARCIQAQRFIHCLFPVPAWTVACMHRFIQDVIFEQLRDSDLKLRHRRCVTHGHRSWIWSIKRRNWDIETLKRIRKKNDIRADEICAGFSKKAWQYLIWQKCQHW